MNSASSLVIGTAGHIDHGKTSLIRALTGVDTDTLAEEKQRGITIDLGFASYIDDSGKSFAFIDVPGHEKFIHNMLAGASGMDAVLLVVAADEGVMPQTREHLQICHLLNIRQGLIVLSCCDRVEDPEMLELCIEELKELVAGTFLENAPMLPVSSITQEGIPELKQALLKLHKCKTLRSTIGNFRMNIDRTFSLKGLGTVVTGSVSSGNFHLGEELWQYPQQKTVRIRGMQTHGAFVETGHAGQRLALNVSDRSCTQITRGDQLASPHSLLNSYILNVELQLLKELPHPLKSKQRIRLHLGSREVMGRVFLLEESQLQPGEKTLAQLRLESQVSSCFADRFVIRNFSPLQTLGGGRVLDPAPHKSRRLHQELASRLKILCGSEDEAGNNSESTKKIAEEVIYLQSLRGVSESEFLIRSGFSKKQSQKTLRELQSRQIILGLDSGEKRYVHTQHIQRVGAFLTRILERFHATFPERQGLTRSELHGKIHALFHEKQMEGVLGFLQKQAILAKKDGTYFLPTHQPTHSEEQKKQLENCLKLLKESGLQPLRRTALLKELGIELKEGMLLLKQATHDKQLIQVAEDLFYLPEHLQQIQEALKAYFKQHPEITVIEFKNLIGVARKHAIDLLEYCDTQHLTIRKENHRVLGGGIGGRNLLWKKILKKVDL